VFACASVDVKVLTGNGLVLESLVCDSRGLGIRLGGVTAACLGLCLPMAVVVGLFDQRKRKKKNFFGRKKFSGMIINYQGFFVLKQRIAMGDFHVSWEKCRVGLMMYADGAKLSFKLDTSLVFKKLL
jgi:hypothetical protein